MEELIKVIKKYRLGSFYINLPVELKEQWLKDAAGLPLTVVPSQKGSSFFIENAAQLLWTSAANAIPRKHYALAERLLHKALQLADSIQDKAWIHGNLTQLYHLQMDKIPGAKEKCRHHCRETINTGYFQGWCEKILGDINK
ncbi:MAG: hypothetical protein H0Z40_03360 [Desulfotomaculum sp.]|nr:hypothetical protein [Desulfotomaculum sp.]